ncbi:hypothetical protein [Aurantiacibacter gilvus]|uniref:Surface antigen domain-containing protein n=1 Tax=Aurantiacibacter gilvus TaxID=3139141 RepID=A0ABU9IEM8_9SPHN
MNKLIRTSGAAATFVALLALAMPAQAQFGGLGRIVNDARRAAENQPQEDETPQTPEECRQNGSESVGGAILGGIIERTARDAAYDAGLGSFVPVSEFSDQISSAIACKLDPDEQRQMADATIEATRSDTSDGEAEVGSTSAWVSETRPGVSGRSTVTGREEASANGMECVLVADVIIVEGEETRADKRMCRRPPSRRYARMA